ncbi:UNVERIFIED_CONTAM: Abscisic acid receptor PYL8 [Sesamum latifolium]
MRIRRESKGLHDSLFARRHCKTKSRFCVVCHQGARSIPCVQSGWASMLGKLFPYVDMHKWMSYGNDGKHPGCDQSYFGRREFSFTLDNDIYLRFQSFNNVAELENAIKEKCPFKIDIGPMYSVDDISDYDDVRFCCSGADVCSECWPLMTVAIKVIDTALRVVVVVSIVGFVMVKQEGKGNENSLKKVSLAGRSLHPFLGRSYAEVLKDFFEEKYILSQNLFSDEERYEKILEMIPDESITSDLRGKWLDNKRSRDNINVVRWGQLKHLLQSGKQKVQGIHRSVEEIVFSFTYPRLDLEVSKHMNHLLKAPFCVHPKTGRVCVPIDPKHCEEFDPSAVPTLSKLLDELNMGALGTGGEEELENTSLGKSIRYFRSSFLQPLLKSCKEEIESSYAAKIQQSKNSLSWQVAGANGGVFWTVVKFLTPDFDSHSLPLTHYPPFPPLPISYPTSGESSSTGGFLVMVTPMNGDRRTGGPEEDFIRRHHKHDVRENQCTSSLVKHIKAPLPLVWSLVRRFDQPQRYKPFVSRCIVQGDLQIGTVREVNVKSGLPATTSKERLELLDDEEHIFSMRIVGGDHRLKNYSSTITVHPEIIDGRPGTMVIESFVVDVPEGNTKDETCYFVEALIKCNLKSLADVSERLAVQDRTEPIDRV